MQRCLFSKELELSQRRGVVPWSVDLEVIYIEIIIEFLASQGEPVIKKKKKMWWQKMWGRQSLGAQEEHVELLKYVNVESVTMK